MPREIESAKQAGFASYLTQPVKVAEVWAAMDDAFAEAS
jgi:hypothetical protein